MCRDYVWGARARHTAYGRGGIANRLSLRTTGTPMAGNASCEEPSIRLGPRVGAASLTALSYGRLSVHHTPWTGDESTCASRPVPRQTRTSTPSAWRGSLAPLLFSRARICFTNSATGSEAHGRCMKPHRPLIAGRIVPQLVMEGLARCAVGWSDPGQSKKCIAS